MKCPRCNCDDFYQPFMGKGECVNWECDLFNEKHAKASGVLTPSDKRNLRLKQRSEKPTLPMGIVPPRKTVPIDYTVKDPRDDIKLKAKWTIDDDAKRVFKDGAILIEPCRMNLVRWSDSFGRKRLLNYKFIKPPREFRFHPSMIQGGSSDMFVSRCLSDKYSFSLKDIERAKDKKE